MITTTADRQLQVWLDAFDSAMARHDVDGATSLFQPDAAWRDFVAFTWNILTVEGQAAIRELLGACLERTEPASWQAAGPAQLRGDVVEGMASFETAVARCSAVIRLKEGRCWTLMTVVTELKGFEESTGSRRPIGHPAAYRQGRRNWRQQREQDALELGITRQPYCVIVGAGHCGLSLGAVLKQHGVPTLIVDRRQRPSDTWRSRHDTLYLHTPSFFDQMPYLHYPDSWPLHPSKDQFADWLDAYRRLMDLDVWTDTECVDADFDDARQEWRLRVERSGKSIELNPKQLVFATGLFSAPKIPDLPGRTRFKGILRHASAHRHSADYAGRRCVVVGAGTTAHDLCAELWEAGADVTMVQRSPTIVIRLQRLLDAFSALYGEAATAQGMTVEQADRLFASLPLRHFLQQQRDFVRDVQELDAGFYDKLRQAGFQLTFGEADAGILAQIFRHPSGYYIDVGASQLIIDRCIKLRSGVSVDALTEHAVILSDGSEIAADLVILATGYDRQLARQVLPPAMVDAVGPLWGFGSGIRNDPGPWEGELRNMWKPTAQPGLWFHHHGVGGSRFYSHLLGLQIKARAAGLATPVYRPGKATAAAGQARNMGLSRLEAA